jgi:hypothetical protein
MTTEQLFSYANLFALVGWIPLLLAPVRRAVMVAAARWVAAILAGLYTVLFVGGIVLGGGGEGGADLTMTAAGLAAAFSRPEVLLVGWVHYLAFDLWVGAWIVEDAPGKRVPHWLLVPILAATFLAGPIGLLAYLLVRATRR